MSILIKGMKMPTACLKGGCPIDGASCLRWEDEYWSNWKDNERMRHPDCPLVEIPAQHGRLIDADEFFASLSMDDKTTIVEAMHINELLSAAPTIIPAEEVSE